MRTVLDLKVEEGWLTLSSGLTGLNRGLYLPGPTSDLESKENLFDLSFPQTVLVEFK